MRGTIFGARQFDRVREVFRLAIIAATCITSAYLVMAQAAPGAIAGAFTGSSELIAQTVTGMRIVFAVFPIVGFQMVTSSFFQAIGKAKISILLSLTRQLIFLIPGLIVLNRLRTCCPHWWRSLQSGARDSMSPMQSTQPDWRTRGVRIVRAGQLDPNTPQTPGMIRAAAITNVSAGAKQLWAGTVVVEPNAKTGAHHHGELETVLYIVKGRARFRWGDRLEFVEEAGPGDYIYVPPFVPHQEINARGDEPVEAVVVRSGQEPVVINLNIESPEPGPDSAEPFHPPSARA